MFKLLLLLAFVLLLNAPSPVDSKKVANVLKNVGRRYVDLITLEGTRAFSNKKLRPKNFEYYKMNDEERNASRWENGKLMWRHIAASSSTENPEYKDAIYWLSEVTHENMTAEICGDSNQYNGFQWIKHMRQQAAQYKQVDLTAPPRYIVKNTVPSVLQVIMILDLEDKNGIHAEMHYGVTLKSEYWFAGNASIFSITHVKMGGTCMEHGEIQPLFNENDPMRYLEDKPSGLHLLNIFAPKLLQYAEKTKVSDIDFHNLPMAWLEGISDDAAITVPQDGVPQPVVYTKAQFIQWYDKLSVMWHPAKGDENWLTKQEASYNDDVLIGRVGMKLQIGVKDDAAVHDWQFKIKGKKDGKVFQITQVDVLSPLSLKSLKQESYDSYYHLLASVFDFVVKDHDSWFPAYIFVANFQEDQTKRFGNTRFCAYKEIFDFSFAFYWKTSKKAEDAVAGYYHNDLPKEEVATDEWTFRWTLRWQPAEKRPMSEGEFFGLHWTFNMKWDQQNQFYYIKENRLGCGEVMTPTPGRLYKEFVPKA